MTLLARVNGNENLKTFLRYHNAISSQPKIKHPEDTCHSSVPSDAPKPISSDSTPPQPQSPASDIVPNVPNTPMTTAPNDLSRVSGEPQELTKTERKAKVRSSLKSNCLSLDYSNIERKDVFPPRPLNSFSLLEQENLLMKDLLYVLIGVEGDYIRLRPHEENSRKNVLIVDESADKLLRTLAIRITNLCPQFSSVIHFIDEIDTGLVNQALAAAMRGVVKDYLTLVAQLEFHWRRNNLTLQKMWYFLQPFLKNMEILKYFSRTICQVSLHT